jgi:hypothetical protein
MGFRGHSISKLYNSCENREEGCGRKRLILVCGSVKVLATLVGRPLRLTEESCGNELHTSCTSLCSVFGGAAQDPGLHMNRMIEIKMWQLATVSRFFGREIGPPTLSK